MAKKPTILKKFLEGRTVTTVNEILPYIKKEDKILDLGSGSCQITRALKEKGFNVTPVDVENKSYFNDLKPLIYDGQKLPFKNKSFDVVLLITVLHHTKNPEEVLKEAARVGKKLIIIEDVYNSSLQKFITQLMDSTLNMEFLNHPHSNKNDAEWQETFQNLGLKLLDSKYHKWWRVFLSATYCCQA